MADNQAEKDRVRGHRRERLARLISQAQCPGWWGDGIDPPGDEVPTDDDYAAADLLLTLGWTDAPSHLAAEIESLTWFPAVRDGVSGHVRPPWRGTHVRVRDLLPVLRAREVPTLLYHWSPSRNRASIQRDGLRPGLPANGAPEWRAPHVCYGETPSAALGLTLLGEELDLWMVRTVEGGDFTLANEGQEWRTTETVGAFYVATRPSEGDR